MNTLPPKWINPAWNNLTAEEEMEAERIIRRFEKAVSESGDAELLLAEIAATLPESSPLRQAVLVELLHSETERKLLQGKSAEDVQEPASHGRLGRYELKRILGQGSSGVVFLAHDPLLDRRVAIKIPHRRGSAMESNVQQLQHEARAAAGLNHPGIVRTLEVGECGGSLFLVSEYIEGESFRELIARSTCSFQESARIVRQIAMALFCAHQQGIIHRDLKPSNILMDSDGEPHLADFGTARILSDEMTSTSTGQLVGTPAYMSPEQAAGQNRTVGIHSDIFSLGTILYEALTGSLPFQGSAASVLAQIVMCDPRPPRDLVPAVPSDLQTICLKAMSPQPSQRYQSAKDFAEDLNRFLSGLPVLARPAGYLERAFRFCRRHKAASVSAGLAGLFLTAGLVATAWQWHKAERLLEATQRLQETADERFERAHRTIAAITHDLRQGSIQDSETSTSDLLRTTTEYYSEYVSQFGNDQSPRGRRTIAEALLVIADHELSLGETDEAIRNSRRSAQLWTSLHEEDPKNIELTAGVARAYLQQSQAFAAQQNGQTAASEAALRGIESLSLLTEPQLMQDSKGGALILAKLHQQYAELSMSVGQIQPAEQHLRDGLRGMQLCEMKQTSESLWQQSMLAYHLARVLKNRGAFGEAGDHFAEAARLFQDPLQRIGSETLFVEHCLFYETEMLCQQKQYGRAAKKCREGISRLESATRKRQEETLICTNLLAKFWYFAGQIAYEENDLPAAETGYQNAVSLWTLYSRNHAEGSSVERDLAAAHHNLGRIFQERDLTDKAEAAYRSALVIRLNLAEKNPDMIRHASDAAGSVCNLCDVLIQKGHEAEADELLQQIACSWQSSAPAGSGNHPLQSAVDAILAKAATIRKASSVK